MSKARLESYLFEEVPGDGRRIRFRYPSRRMRFTAAERLAANALILMGLVTYLRFTKAPWYSWAVGTLIALPCAFWACGCLRIIWSRQDVILDLDIEAVQAVERRPFRTTLQTLPFAEFLEVALITCPDHTWGVALRHSKDQHVWLGLSQVLVPAENLAERLASLLRLPVRRGSDLFAAAP